MCNAWNHDIGCPCGFGGDTGGGGGGFYSYSASYPTYSRTFSYTRSMRQLAIELAHSVTFPTICWYCGEEIYLYASEYGGFVIFDSLGGDWPKHECRGWNASSVDYSPPVLVRANAKVPVPANVREDYPGDGMSISGVVTDSRDVFSGKWLYRVVVHEAVKPGTWIRGIARQVKGKWHLMEVTIGVDAPPSDVRASSHVPQNNKMQQTRHG